MDVSKDICCDRFVESLTEEEINTKFFVPYIRKLNLNKGMSKQRFFIF